MSKWEEIYNYNDGLIGSQMGRMKVLGGWIVKSHTHSGNGSMSESMVFVPDITHEWEISN